MRNAFAAFLSILVTCVSLRAGPDLPPGVYELRIDSAFVRGCFPPCRCPLFRFEGVRGTASVSPLFSQDGFIHYDLDEVSLSIPSSPPVQVSGTGRYLVSNAGDRHELRLELQVGDADPQLFESGLLERPPRKVPSIEIIVSKNGMVCQDEVFELHLVFPDTLFLRGDCNGDGVVDITDPVANLSHQFLGAFDPSCLDALDYDNSGGLDVTDPILSLTHQFLGGPPPSPPGKERCGADPTDDELSCESFPFCGEND